VKIEIREDIAAPQEFVFRRLTDFARHERQALRRGAAVKRLDGNGQVGTGSAWDIAFTWRGKPRDVRAEITEWTPHERLRILSVMSGLDTTTAVDVIALSRMQTRVNVAIELEPKSLTARLLVQSLKLARGGMTTRLQARLREMTAEIAKDWAETG
jgi:uncharacterized protein YndB with AHSA1/START domain